jgi:hypothetical protein
MSDVSGEEVRPLDYVWNGQRVTHYRNHGGDWLPCPATPESHHTLRVGPCGPCMVEDHGSCPNAKTVMGVKVFPVAGGFAVSCCCVHSGRDVTS